jgi:hypothetical protein
VDGGGWGREERERKGRRNILSHPGQYLNLDENMWFQILTFFGMLVTFFEFMVQFASMDCFFDWVPAWGQQPLEGQAIVLGVITFSFTFGTTGM